MDHALSTPPAAVTPPDFCWHIRHPTLPQSRRMKVDGVDGILVFSTMERAKQYVDLEIGYEVRVVGMSWAAFVEGVRDTASCAILDLVEGEPVRTIPIT
jgi:hypothetical protein